MPKIDQISLPGVETVEDLRRGVEAALNRLVLRLNDETINTDVDINDHRIRNLRAPAEWRDAVNVAYVQKVAEGLERKLISRLHRPDLRKAYGFGPQFEITPGGFTLDDAALESFTFNPTYFEVDGTYVDLATGGIDNTVIGTGAIMTPNLYAGAILVGGGTNRPTQFTVYNHAVEAIGWIGDDYGNSGYDGAWFKRVLIGGTDPASAGFYADVNGNTVMRSVYVYDTSGTVGWIGNDGTYIGGWFKQIFLGGTSPASSKIYTDMSGNAYIFNANLTLSNTSGTIGWIGSSGTNTGGWFKSLYAGGTDAASAPFYTDVSGNLFISGSVARPVSITVVNTDGYGTATSILGHQIFLSAVYGTDTRLSTFNVGAGLTQERTAGTSSLSSLVFSGGFSVKVAGNPSINLAYYAGIGPRLWFTTTAGNRTIHLGDNIADFGVPLVMGTGGTGGLTGTTTIATIDGNLNAASQVAVAGTKVLGTRLAFVANPTVSIPTTGSVTADSVTGNLYNYLVELQSKLQDVRDRLVSHGLIASS